MKTTILKEIKGTYSMLYSSKDVIGRDEFLDAIEKILAGYEFKIVEPKVKENTIEKESQSLQPPTKIKENNSSNNQSNKQIDNSNSIKHKSTKDNSRQIRMESRERRPHGERKHKKNRR